MDIFNCKELRQVESLVLLKKFGKIGKSLYDLCRGIDERKVKSNSQRKSVSVETTFNENIEDWQDSENSLHKLLTNLSQRLEKIGLSECVRKIYVKVKSENFVLHSAEARYFGLDLKLLIELLKGLRERSPKPIRLLGIGVKFMEQSKLSSTQQLNIPF